MPELPEVERAASLTREIAEGRVIERVETTEDSLVYSGITHEEFAKAITGRKVKEVGRYGKCFYLLLDGEGPSPVLHFGMTGMLQIKGQEPTYYRTKPKDKADAWPPRFMKFILHIGATTTAPSNKLAFLDARRLGRIRLCTSPMTEPPILNLGFDPILSMPDLDDYAKSVRKRTCTIKALLLDQSFNAGVGNWVADEILYQARVHPEERVNVLTDTQIMDLHSKTASICSKAVEVNADSSRFPKDWLFKHRWGKGKKAQHTLLLPNGSPATIRWSKVGGRTSAYVTELQILSRKDATVSHSMNDVMSDGELTPLSDEESEATPSLAKRKVASHITRAKSNFGARTSKRVRTSVMKEKEVMEDVEDNVMMSQSSRRSGAIGE